MELVSLLCRIKHANRMIEDMSILEYNEQPNAKPTVAILGAGSMGGAILEGFLAASESVADPIYVTTFSEQKKAAYAETDRVVAHSLETDERANVKAVDGADVVILGVKPGLILDVLAQIVAHLKPGAIVISVAAGIKLESMRAIAPQSVHVVRAMPNTPVLVRNGVTGITGATGTPTDALNTAERLFSTVGQVIMLPNDAEDLLNSLTAVSGGGPAYVFFLIEKMIAETEKLGFASEQAKAMVEDTFLGASLLLKKSGLSPEQLRKNVTSPNGTTEQALNQLAAADLGETFEKAFLAARNRAIEMG